MAPLLIEPVPCLSDNYAYLVREPASETTAVVDPSEAEPVTRALERHGWKLDYILCTHHHWDHVGGNLALKTKTGCRIVGPKKDLHRIPGGEIGVSEGEPFRLGKAELFGLEVPGHTLGAISYWFPEANAVFTGDTLFLLGCGRLFEGTPEQMFASLGKLKKLPGETRIYCGHEYTEANARFALAARGESPVLSERMARDRALRAKGLPTVPATIAEELAANPFLQAESVQEFAELRRAKDSF